MSKNINSKSKDIAIIALSAAIITICSVIKIPFAVPVTLQSLAVLTLAGLFGAKRSALSVVIYIILGAIGVPVFSGMAGGIGILFGTSGGYLIGFIFTALIVGMAADKKVSAIETALSMIAGTVVCYIFGTIWYIVVCFNSQNEITFTSVVSVCVLPFIIPDGIKIATAVFLCKKLKNHIK